MANYSIVIGSKFNPFSYQELLQPALMATQAHRELEDQYSDLAVKSNIWEEMANEQTDPYAYKMYKAYSNDLEKQAEQLAREGLTANSRQGLLNMKRRYSSEITPIERAYKARDEEIKAQYEGRAKGIVYEGDASLASLDRYLKNPSIKYNQANSQEGFKRISMAASALAKNLRNYGNSGKFDEYTNLWFQQHGYSPEMINQAINEVQRIVSGDISANDLNTNSVLRNLLADEMKVSGVDRWGNQNARMDYLSRISPALYQAVGQTNISPYENYGARLNARNNNSNNESKISQYALNPSNIYSIRERTEASKNISKFSDYFKTYPDGTTILTPKGEKEFKKIITDPSHYRPDSPSEFRKFMIGLGANPELATVDNFDSSSYGELWNKYLKDNSTDKYDATKLTEYVYPLKISTSAQDNYKARISEALGDNKLYEVDLNPKTNKFERTGNTLSTKDLMTTDYTLTSRRPSEIGNTILILDKEGKIKRYEMPTGINSTAENARDAALLGKLEIQRILMDPNLSEADRLKYEEAYNELNQQQIIFESQLDYVNETKSQEFKPIYVP